MKTRRRFFFSRYIHSFMCEIRSVFVVVQRHSVRLYEMPWQPASVNKRKTYIYTHFPCASDGDAIALRTIYIYIAYTLKCILTFATYNQNNIQLYGMHV